MERLDDPHEKAQRMVLFMAYLYISEGDRDEQIKKAVTSVAYMFEVRGLSTSFVHVALVTRGRAATSRSSQLYNFVAIKFDSLHFGQTIIPLIQSVHCSTTR